MTGFDSPIPWFSGLCLEGEVANQYQLETLEGEPHSREPDHLELNNLAPITIFVGANNSGKSRLLRELFCTLQPAHLKLGGATEEEEDTAPAWQQYANVLQEIRGWETTQLSGLEQVQNREHVIKEGWLPSWAFNILQEISGSFNPRRPSMRRYAGPSEDRAQREVQGWVSRYRDAEKLIPRALAYKSLKRCYVPILRGMRPPVLSHTSQKEGEAMHDCFVQRAVDDYFKHVRSDNPEKRLDDQLGSEHYFKHDMLSIVSGLEIYFDLQRRLLSPEQAKRDSVVRFQNFLADEFFGGQSVVLVPALKNADGSPNDVVYIKIGSSSERPIHDLGDGMQSLIINTYPIVTETERGSLFFLEEPDLCMHPSLQRTFLEVLKAYHRKEGHQFFITTHSNHLLDLVDDPDLVSIYSFSAITHAEHTASAPGTSPRFRIRSAARQDREVLAQLGVRPSATFLANATIWVEGVSDASYLRAYMEAFVHYLGLRGGEDWKHTAAKLKQYKEDQHYAFVEYSGANLEHFAFNDPDDANTTLPQDGSNSPTSPGDPPSERQTTAVPSLCAKAIVIADGDIGTKGDRLQWFRQQLGSRLIVLPGKEIENLIPEKLVRHQVEADHSQGRHGEITDDQLISVHYSGYARYASPCDENSSLIGIGTYLGTKRGFPKYASSDTLARTYKQRWSSAREGIPHRIREAMSKGKTGENPDADVGTEEEVPSYLTHDLLWLCACGDFQERCRRLAPIQAACWKSNAWSSVVSSVGSLIQTTAGCFQQRTDRDQRRGWRSLARS